jgi:hypothetical protein
MSDLKVETQLSKLPTWLNRAGGAGTPPPTVEGGGRKGLGDIPPIVVRVSDFPELVALFTQYGAIQKTRRKLKLLSGKDGKILLAKNTVGAADNQGNVYLGVEFLRQNGKNQPLLAGVMAHEWGHLISNTSKHGNLDHLNWDEIFQLRREEEAAADVFCGRMLAMMGYEPQAIIDFLNQAKKENETAKYYAAPIRGAIIQEAFKRHSERKQVTEKIFQKRIYANPYTSKVISV